MASTIEIINGLWIGDSLGPIEYASITSFLRHGYRYHLYCYSNIANLPPGIIIKDANDILPESRVFYRRRGLGHGSVATFADLFRYKLLMEKGGWWVDTDMICIKPFDFPEPIVFASEDTLYLMIKLTNAAIKLPKGHLVAQHCFEAAEQQDRDQLRWGKTGPDLITRIVREHKLQQFVKPPAVFCPIPWWKWKSVLHPDPSACNERMKPETRAVHLWHEMWRRAGIHREMVYSSESFFSQLLATNADLLNAKYSLDPNRRVPDKKYTLR